MRKLNKKGYLTIEIILGSVIAFAIAFFLIEITAKMISNNDDTFRDTIITTDNALIISGVKEVVENNTDGINNISCNDNICTITYSNNYIGILKIEDHIVKYEKTDPDDTTISYDKYEKKLDSSLSDIKLTSNITGEVTDESNIYFKITGKNIFLDKEYNIIIPIDNLKKNNVCNIPSVISSTNLANYITSLYNRGEKEVVTKNNIEYNTVSCLGLMNDRLGGTTSDYDAGNIRYYGANPNNYIDIGDIYEEDYTANNWELIGWSYDNQAACYDDFDCDTHYSDWDYDTVDACKADIPNWLDGTGYSTVDELCGTTTYTKGTKILYRIIGVFGDKIKLIRNEIIGVYSWDNKDTTTGAEFDQGKNDWTDARLMKLLNPGYESETTGGSLYYNSGSGLCYSEQNNATKTCDFTSIGLSESVKSKIAEVTWNLGGWYSESVYSDQIYGYERGTKVYSERPTTWTGKIALAYPSDYGYAADLGSCTQNLYNYYDSTCISTNWMKSIFTSSSWLLTPSTDSYHSFDARSAGLLSSSPSYAAHGVAPVFYLGSEQRIESGDGSSSSPYKLIVK